MKLGTVHHDGAARVAVAVDDERAVLLDPGLTMTGLISDWATAWPTVELAAAAGQPVPVSRLRWLPPVPRPGKVICVALNISANVDRIMSGPQHPAAFTKPASSLLGHGQPIRLKKEYGRVHPEPDGSEGIEYVNLVALGGPIEVTISGIGTLSNPVELR